MIQDFNRRTAELWGRKPAIGEQFWGSVKMLWPDGSYMPRDQSHGPGDLGQDFRGA